MGGLTRAEEMQAKYDDGATIGDLALEYGISRQRISQIIGPQRGNAHGGRAKLDRFRTERLELVERVRAGELSVADASEISGITEKAFISYAIDVFDIRLVEAHESPLHGTSYRYNRGCRCEECKEASREKRRLRTGKEPPKHGTQNAYTNYGCRCPKCKRWAKRQWAQRRRDDSHSIST